MNSIAGAAVLDRIFLQNRTTPNYLTVLLGLSDGKPPSFHEIPQLIHTYPRSERLIQRQHYNWRDSARLWKHHKSTEAPGGRCSHRQTHWSAFPSVVGRRRLDWTRREVRCSAYGCCFHSEQETSHSCHWYRFLATADTKVRLISILCPPKAQRSLF